ncbi:MAG: formylmethanofuran--tetrahydromethanopterin N-formyltransferase [Burkholderiales bacterium]
MIINGVTIDDTFAEAFGMRAARIVVTAINKKWAYHAANSFVGFSTSVIGCGWEAGIERELSPEETPDGRPGIAILMFAMSVAQLEKQLELRVGQCILTAPTSAVFSGLDSADRINLGRNLRFFGDGFQISKVFAGRRYWRVPVMDGEFLCEETTGTVKSVGGGNFLVLAQSQRQALDACEAAVEAISRVPGVITPFPGGVVRSGSKIGSKYKSLPASTNDAFCPTLRGISDTQLTPGIEAVLEIVIDGLTEEAIRAAMRAGILAACQCSAAAGIRRICAGNYGGKLGKYHFRLRELMA